MIACYEGLRLEVGRVNVLTRVLSFISCVIVDKPLSIYQVLSKSPHKKSKDDFENLFNCNMKKF